MQKMNYILIPNKKELDDYIKNKFNIFALPLKDYSISYDVYFDIDEINELASKYKIFVIINKFLHRKIDDFRKIYPLFNKNIMFIIEDIGLLDVIDKNRIVLNENHIESNYKSINFLYDLGIRNVVINNDLTINEILDIKANTKSTLFHYVIHRNILLYSRRKLVSNYNEYFGIKTNDNSYTIHEDISKESLEVKEENESTTIRNKKIYCGNKHLNELKALDYLIIDTTLMSDIEQELTLKYYDQEVLFEHLNSDDYFLNNDIKYKVGDIK